LPSTLEGREEKDEGRRCLGVSLAFSGGLLISLLSGIRDNCLGGDSDYYKGTGLSKIEVRTGSFIETPGRIQEGGTSRWSPKKDRWIQVGGRGKAIRQWGVGWEPYPASTQELKGEKIILP